MRAAPQLGPCVPHKVLPCRQPRSQAEGGDGAGLLTPSSLFKFSMFQLTHSSSEEEWVWGQVWGGMRKARFMIHMKDPPGNVKHNKWRSIIPVRQTALSSFTFSYCQSTEVFFFWYVCLVFLLVCLKTSLFFLLLNDYSVWWLFQKLHKPPSVDTWW